LPESEIYYHLAKRLNLSVSKEQIPEPGNDNIEKWLERRIGNMSGIGLDQLKKGPVIAPGTQHIAYEDMKFDTPSGKIEIYSTQAEEKWGISRLPDYVEIFQNREAGEFPLHLITPNTGSRIHSQFGNMKIIKETNNDPCIRISPFDAEARGIRNGQTIRVFNDKGDMTGKAEISNRISQGLVVFPNGIWFNESGGINHLISGRETDIGFGAAFHDNRVEIEEVG